MQYDVFISYRRSDQTVARSLVQELEQRGVRVWWDQKIEGGQDWRDAIVEGLQSSTCLVILFSEECNGSKQLKKELAIADTLNKLVVPVLIEDTQPRGHYLYELAALNWIQVFPNPASRAADLADRLVRELGLEPPAPADVPAPAEIPVMAAPEPSSEIAAPEPAPAIVPDMAPAPDISPAAPPPAAAPADTPMSRAAEPAAGKADAVSHADADAVYANIERKRLRDARRKTMRDFLPLHRIDLIPLGVMGIAFSLLISGEWYVYATVELIGVLIMGTAMTLAVYGAVVFPVRYYLRRRRVWLTALMQALHSLLFLALFIGGLFIWWEGNTSATIDESFYYIPPIFFILLIVTVVIYAILSGQRAVRSFRKNVEVL